jgi:hypothetical protein
MYGRAVFGRYPSRCRPGSAHYRYGVVDRGLCHIQVCSLARRKVVAMKPKLNYKTSIKEPAALDLCQTPPYALAPLLPYLRRDRIIWEPATGEGILANALRMADYTVLESDVALGQDFFEGDIIGDTISVVTIITNPPYGIKPAWVERCYELDRPFALLMPTEFQGTGAANRLFGKHGIEIMNFDKRVDFKMPVERWFSNAQFPVSWYCWQLLPKTLMFATLHKPQRTVSRQVWKTNKKTGERKQITEMGYADWIERPVGYNWNIQKFEYDEETNG